MARALSMKDVAERLERLSAMLTHEGGTPVVAVLRRGQPVLAVLPWDLYVGLLQSLASLPEDVASPEREGIRALLEDATTPHNAEPAVGRPAGASSASAPRRPAHRRHPSHPSNASNERTKG